jgi:hypothetical protein
LTCMNTPDSGSSFNFFVELVLVPHKSGTWNSVPGWVLQTNTFEFWFYHTQFQSDSDILKIRFSFG